MRIMLNGVELSRQAEGNLTVGNVLGEVQAEITKGGKIATSVSLDGKPLPTGWRRRERLTSPVSSVNVMEFTVDEPSRLKQQMISDAESLLSTMEKNTATLARSFRIGDEVVANNELAQFLDELKLVVSSMDHASRTNQADSKNPERGEILEAANSLVPTLDRIYKAQAAGDYISIADEIEYELPEHIAKCMKILNELKNSTASSKEHE